MNFYFFSIVTGVYAIELHATSALLFASRKSLLIGKKTISIVTAFSDYEVVCSVLLFRPEEGDIGIARLKEQDKKLGLVLSMSFFGDIHVSPSYFLPDTYYFQPTRQCWYVKADNGGDIVYNKITSNCYVRFKVRDTLFPKLQYAATGGGNARNEASNAAGKALATVSHGKPEMLVKAGVNYKMFGPIEMWMSPQQYNDLYKPNVPTAAAIAATGSSNNKNRRQNNSRNRGKKQQRKQRPTRKTKRVENLPGVSKTTNENKSAEKKSRKRK